MQLVGMEKQLQDGAREPPLFRESLTPEHRLFSQGALGLNLSRAVWPWPSHLPGSEACFSVRWWESLDWGWWLGDARWCGNDPALRRCPVTHSVCLPSMCWVTEVKEDGCLGCKWNTTRGSVESKELSFLVTNKETGRSLSKHRLPLGLAEGSFYAEARRAWAGSWIH